MCIIIYTVLILLMLPYLVGSLIRTNCSLRFPYSSSYFQNGDYIIGGIISVRTSLMYPKTDFTELPYHFNITCRIMNMRNYQTILAFVFAITEINKNPELLPNLTLGFHIVDSCLTEEKAMIGAIDIVSGKGNPIPNYKCAVLPNLLAFVDGISSKVTLLLARVFGIYKIPQISYASMDPVLSDKKQFPFFYRTVPNEILQYHTFVKVIQHFFWTWVGVLVSDNEAGLKMSQALQKEFKHSGICLAFLEFIPYRDGLDDIKRSRIVRTLANTVANVIIAYGDREYMLTLQILLYMFPITEKVWIISSQWDVLSGFDYYFLSFQPFNGSLAVTLHTSTIPDFEIFFLRLTPDVFPNDIFIHEVWWELFYCLWRTYEGDDLKCNGTEQIRKWEYTFIHKDISLYSFSIYNAVYSLAYALHYLHLQKKGKKKGTPSIQAWEMHKYLKRISITTNAGTDVRFDENGDMYSDFVILNWIVYPNQSLSGIRVGKYNQTSNKNLIINESLIQWSQTFNQTPHSVCNKRCGAGYRKVFKEGYPSCCYDCSPCQESEISNLTETCQKCPENQWPNIYKDLCIDKIITYLSYNEPLGISLAFVSVSFFILTCIVMFIFIKNQNTPVVKANNREISFLLLFSLKICFLCNLMFIGHPNQVTCILRQSVFGITFSIAISSLLAKTVTVVIAFNATRPGSRLRNCLGSRVPTSIVIICSTIQAAVCTSWLLTSPPFPYYNTQDVVGMIIVECDEHSQIGFYLILGFMGFLAFTSFVVAFFARMLPDMFNEAKFITFSMLVFCSVWISFVPAYLSTKGKYVVAVEIFAILASSSGILGCIFIPKCYIMLSKPEENTKKFISKKLDS